MTLTELAEHIQFTVDHDGRVTAVVVSPDAWQQIIELLEDAEDTAAVAKLLPRLAAGPTDSHALLWRDIRDEWR